MVEADFQREYGIDLVADLGTMTWRRFQVLLVGLSDASRCAGLLADPDDTSGRGPRRRTVTVVDDF